MGSMTRVSLTTQEKIALKGKNPAEWEMNLLLKVIKYTNFEPLERYDDVWCALDDLIATRGEIFAKDTTKKIAAKRMKELFKCVTSDISKFDLETELEEKLCTEIEDNLMSSIMPYYLIILHAYIYYVVFPEAPSREEGLKFHELLLKQKDGWKDFEGKLYERGS